MRGTGLPDPPEFRRRIVELVRLGRTPEELSREFEPRAVTIASWARPGPSATRAGAVTG